MDVELKVTIFVRFDTLNARMHIDFRFLVTEWMNDHSKLKVNLKYGTQTLGHIIWFWVLMPEMFRFKFYYYI